MRHTPVQSELHTFPQEHTHVPQPFRRIHDTCTVAISRDTVTSVGKNITQACRRQGLTRANLWELWAASWAQTFLLFTGLAPIDLNEQSSRIPEFSVQATTPVSDEPVLHPNCQFFIILGGTSGHRSNVLNVKVKGRRDEHIIRITESSWSM